jgi:nucleoside-diphosphate-sugar epimerase
MAEVYPSVPYRKGDGEFDTLLSIGKARKLLGYEPQHSWRDAVLDVLLQEPRRREERQQ